MGAVPTDSVRTCNARTLHEFSTEDFRLSFSSLFPKAYDEP